MQPAWEEHVRIGRRASPRLRLRVPAQLATLDGPKHVILDDLSETGAQITLPQEQRFSSGLLQWLTYDVFADLIWQEGLSCGLLFEERLTEEVLLETRRQAPGLKDHENRRRKIAEAWTRGGADW
jgi:hypothetical protein